MLIAAVAALFLPMDLVEGNRAQRDEEVVAAL